MAAPPSSSAAPSSSSSSSATPLPLPSSSAGPSPKILLAKPPLSGPAASKFSREDDPSAAAALRSRVPPLGSLNLLVSDTWDLHADRALPFLTENMDFTVVGVIGPPGVGKSTIMNELYGFDGSSPGMLPPFAVQSEEARLMARHCTIGIEIRVSSERLILLDTQPIFSPSVLVEMMKPDGSSSIPVLNKGIHDTSVWHLLHTVDMLKHNIPDPSSLTPGHTQNMNVGSDKEWKDNIMAAGEEFLATPVFVHTKLQDQDISPPNVKLLKKTLLQYFGSSLFGRNIARMIDPPESQQEETSDLKSPGLDLVLLPVRVQDERPQYESYTSMLGKLRDQILSMNSHSFTKAVSERDWLRNSAKIWEMVKRSPIIAEYCRSLQSSGLFRK